MVNIYNVNVYDDGEYDDDDDDANDGSGKKGNLQRIQCNQWAFEGVRVIDFLTIWPLPTDFIRKLILFCRCNNLSVLG